jgi:hypothetical protein
VTNGLEVGMDAQTRMLAFARDLRAGMPPLILAERHLAPELGTDHEPERAAYYLRQLHGVGLLRQVQLDPVFREVSLPVKPTATHAIDWKNGVAHGRIDPADSPWLSFALKRPRRVYAVRLKFSYGDRIDPNAWLQTVWGRSDRADSDGRDASSEGRQFGMALTGLNQEEKVLRYRDGKFHWETSGRERVVTIWVNQLIDWFRLYPDAKPRVFQLARITLLVPAEEDEPSPSWEDLVADGAVILDNDGPGFVQTGGGWHLYEGPPPVHGGGLRFALKGTGANKASWEVGEIAPGLYTVQATWTENADRASDATYRLYDGTMLAASIRVDQRQAPSGPAVQGVRFQELTTIQVNNGRLRIELDDAADGIVIADAIRVVQMR